MRVESTALAGGGGRAHPSGSADQRRRLAPTAAWERPVRGEVSRDLLGAAAAARGPGRGESWRDLEEGDVLEEATC